MSISYSALNNKRRVTLPSVESWGQNMGINPDPPRGIMTRKIDKAQDTSAYTQMIQESGDRFGDAISVYARGVDPMVGVSYSNNGSNSGGGNPGFAPRRNGQANFQQSFMPYTVGREGAFRPPIVPPQNLLPLSRLPRIWTSSFTNPAFPDFSKKMMFPTMDDKTTGIRKAENMLRVSARPTATFSVNVPLIEPFTITKVIKDPLKKSATTNSSAKEMSHSHNEFTHSGGLNVRTQNVIHNNVFTAKRGLTKLDEEFEYNGRQQSLERNVPVYEARTNTSQNIHVRQEQPVMREFESNRPLAYATTNVGTNVAGERIDSRDYHLRPKISAGEYQTNGFVPVFETGHENPEIDQSDPRKTRMNRSVYDMQVGRNLDFQDTLRNSAFGAPENSAR